VVTVECQAAYANHHLADDGGDGDLALPGEEAGVMVGHVEQRRVIEAHATDGRAGMRDHDDLTQARLQHGDLSAMGAHHGEGLAGLGHLRDPCCSRRRPVASNMSLRTVCTGQTAM